MKKTLTFITIISLLLLSPGLYSQTQSIDMSSSSTLSVSNKIQIQLNGFPKSIQWLTKNYGKNTDFYLSKLGHTTLDAEKYQSLVAAVYQQNSKLAAVALAISAYPKLNKDTNSLSDIQDILLSDIFLRKMFELSAKELLREFPIELRSKSFYDIALDVNYQLYEQFPLLIKIDPYLIQRYFDEAYENEDIKSQQIAAQYAPLSMKRSFLSQNGLLLEGLRPKYKSSFKLVYTAAFENDRAIQFASDHIQEIYDRKGILALNTSSAFIKFYQDIINEKLEELNQRISNIIAPIRNSAKYYGIKGIHFINPVLPNNRIYTESEKNIENPNTVEDESIKEDESKHKEISFDYQSYPVRSKSLIKKIEKERGRSLLELYEVAKIDQNGSFYIGQFMRQDKEYLGTMLYKKGSSHYYSDYRALHSYDGHSIWRYLDDSKFDPSQFEVHKIFFGEYNEIHIIFEWKGVENNITPCDLANSNNSLCHSKGV